MQGDNHGADRELRVARVIDYIFTHSDQDLSRRSLAAVANYSAEHLPKLFKQMVGQSPKQYVLERYAGQLGVPLYGIITPHLRNTYRAFLPLSKDLAGCLPLSLSLPLTLHLSLPGSRIKGGLFACFSVTGDLRRTNKIAHYFYRQWLPASGYRIAGIAGFETFGQNPAGVSYVQLQRHIHIPIEPVGWTGAVAAFLALALTGLNSSNAQTVRAVYIAMEPVTSWVIVPVVIASLVTGVLLSLGTRWGLLRHYWVIFKLLISGISLPLLLLHTGIIHRVAYAAMSAQMSPSDLRQERIHLVVASMASLAALVSATLLSVYKPRRLTVFGSRRSC
jgi:hypothetical protein